MFCTGCGYRNSEGVNFCSRCGASLIAEHVDAQTTMSYAPGDTGPLTPLARGSSESATLVIRSGGGRAGETYALAAERVTIGRHPDSDVFLDDVTVSRNHAEVVRDGDTYVISDEGSLNGTYVNRKRIERHTLVDGDELQIGKYKLTFITP
jgi:pSer/pThr/pTyr-binding forkhead associated (FHA) protein